MIVAVFGIASVLLAPVMPLVILGGVFAYIGANRFYDFITKGKRK